MNPDEEEMEIKGHKCYAAFNSGYVCYSDCQWFLPEYLESDNKGCPMWIPTELQDTEKDPYRPGHRDTTKAEVVK